MPDVRISTRRLKPLSEKFGLNSTNDVLDKAFDLDVRVAKILHVPSMSIELDSCSEALLEFVREDLSEDGCAASVIRECKGLSALMADLSDDDEDDDFRTTEIISHMRRNMTKTPFLVLVEFADRSYINRDKEPFTGMFQSGGLWWWNWFATASIEDAIKRGVEKAEACALESWKAAPPRNQAASA